MGAQSAPARATTLSDACMLTRQLTEILDKSTLPQRNKVVLVEL